LDKSKVLREEPVPVPLCLPQIPHGLTMISKTLHFTCNDIAFGWWFRIASACHHYTNSTCILSPLQCLVLKFAITASLEHRTFLFYMIKGNKNANGVLHHITQRIYQGILYTWNM